MLSPGFWSQELPFQQVWLKPPSYFCDMPPWVILVCWSTCSGSAIYMANLAKCSGQGPWPMNYLSSKFRWKACVVICVLSPWVIFSLLVHFLWICYLGNNQVPSQGPWPMIFLSANFHWKAPIIVCVVTIHDMFVQQADFPVHSPSSDTIY